MSKRFLTIVPVVLLLLIVTVALGAGEARADGSALWFGRYYSNPNLAGAPVAYRSTGLIDFNWGTGSPLAGMPADNFSVRWTAQVSFEPGTYRFTTVSDDGVRLFVGAKHVITNWTAHTPTTDTVVVSLLGGRYPVALDYFEADGAARISLDWTRLGPPSSAQDVALVAQVAQPPTPTPVQPPAALPTWTPADWYGQYWANSDLSGSPVTGGLLGVINFDWGSGSPGDELPPDNFSARWTTFVTLEPGTYRFVVESAGGVSLFFNDRHIIYNWQEHARTINAATVSVAGGRYPVAVEYFEKSGQALIRVGWERLSGAAPAPGELTATTTTYLRLRGGPGTQYTILTVAAPGTTVRVVGRTANSRWIQVEYRGMVGWMGAGYLRIGGSLTNTPITG
jgi:hypothetical protein